MTAQEFKMTAWEMDATASALEANLEIARSDNYAERNVAIGRAMREIASLQAYVHSLQAEADKEGALS